MAAIAVFSRTWNRSDSPPFPMQFVLRAAFVINQSKFDSKGKRPVQTTYVSGERMVVVGWVQGKYSWASWKMITLPYSVSLRGPVASCARSPGQVCLWLTL